jgi:hypothetical protein
VPQRCCPLLSRAASLLQLAPQNFVLSSAKRKLLSITWHFGYAASLLIRSDWDAGDGVDRLEEDSGEAAAEDFGWSDSLVGFELTEHNPTRDAQVARRLQKNPETRRRDQLPLRAPRCAGRGSGSLLAPGERGEVIWVNQKFLLSTPKFFH